MNVMTNRTCEGRARRDKARARIRALQDTGSVERYQRFHPVEFGHLLGDAGYLPIAGGQVNGNGARPAMVAALPFTAGSHEHVEGPAITLTVPQTAAVQQQNPIDVPAYGYFRSLFIEVVAAGGTGGTIAADGPWNIIQSISLQDVNGANIVNPVDGYGLYLMNLFGGYAFNNNPANYPWFSGVAPNPAFGIRVPVEVIARDALGALANQNSAATYKLNLAINSTAAAYSVAPSPLPTYTIRVWYEGWTIPAAQSMRGEPQAQTPPLLDTGQSWSNTNQRAVLVGDNTLGVTRVGNLIRLLIGVARTGAGARSDTVLPDPVALNWDGNQIWKSNQNYMKAYLYEKFSGALTFPAGVFAFPFNHQFIGRMGNETPDLWVPTTQSTRLDIVGTCAAAGSWQYLVNDIAPVEVDQAQRYQVPSDTGRLTSPAQ